MQLPESINSRSRQREEICNGAYRFTLFESLTMVKKATASKGRPTPQKAQSEQKPASNGTDAVALLKADHRKVEQLFQQYDAASSNEEKTKLAKQICTELIVHTKLEEELFYPACREKKVESDMLDEAQVEHDGAKVMITEIMTLTPDSEYYDAKVCVLSEYIKHHVGEEEKPGEGIFAKAQAAGVDMAALGKRIGARKQELLPQVDDLGPPQPRSLQCITSNRNQNLKEIQMQRNNQGRDRDDQGRFTSDDRGSYRGGYSSQSYDDDQGSYGNRNDQGRYSSGSRGQGGGNYGGGQDRDEYGRFTSDNDYDGNGNGGNYSRQGGNRSWDDDNNYGGRGNYSQSNDRDRDEYGRFTSDDDRGYSSGNRGGNYSQSSSRDDDNYGDNRGYSQGGNRGGYSQSNDRDRDEYGRFTSDDSDNSSGGRGSNQYSQSSRGGRGSSQNSDSNRDEQGRFSSGGTGNNRGGSSGSRGGNGGHSRSGSGSRSQGQGQSQEHRGWYGDSKGHAEAARRGWQNR